MDGVIPTDYRFDLEDKEEIIASSVDAEYAVRGAIPDQIDPRNSELATHGFLQVEMQGSVGACQGVSLTDTAEFAYAFATGEVIQFDWMHAYIESQKENNIRTDGGSTLSGGTRAAKRGFRPKKGNDYPNAYPGWKYVTDAMKKEAEPFPLMSSTVMKDANNIREYIGSGIGIVQIGMPWGPAMKPDAKGIVNDWYTTREDGGHAWTICGYVQDVVVGARSPHGWWPVCKNSWSIRWGLRGYFYFNPVALNKCMQHPHTVCLGRSDMNVPKPRKIKFDFTKQSILG